MKTNRLLTSSLSLMLGLALLASIGCKKKEAASNPSAVSSGPNRTPPPRGDIPAPPAAQAEETVQVDGTVKPAPGENTIAEGHAFPSLEFASLSGEQVSLKNLKGKVVLIDFWASWCGPCLRTMPDLVQTYRDYHNQGFEIIGISLDRDQSRLERYMQDAGITWQQYYDGLGWDNKMAKRFGIRGIPHVVLVDKNGAVHFNTDYNREKPPLHGVELRNAVAKLCAAPAN